VQRTRFYTSFAAR